MKFRSCVFAAGGVVAVAAVLLSPPALAQVNIESMRSQLDTSSFGGRIRLSFAAYAGNTEGVIMGTSGIVAGRIGPNLGFAMASADYAGSEERRR